MATAGKPLRPKLVFMSEDVILYVRRWTMIELHTLGMLDLRASEARDVLAVLQQPKRLGILAYLAADPPRRFHRRDSLLALFWPDLDEEHARAALRRSLHFLRSALGAEVLTGRG